MFFSPPGLFSAPCAGLGSYPAVVATTIAISLKHQTAVLSGHYGKGDEPSARRAVIN